MSRIHSAIHGPRSTLTRFWKDSLCQIQVGGRARGPVLAELYGVALEVAFATQRSLRTASAAPRGFPGPTLRTRVETTRTVRCRQDGRNDGGEAATSIARGHATEPDGPRQEHWQGVKRPDRSASRDGRARKPAHRWRASTRKPITQVSWVKIPHSGFHRWERPITTKGLYHAAASRASKIRASILPPSRCWSSRRIGGTICPKSRGCQMSCRAPRQRLSSSYTCRGLAVPTGTESSPGTETGTVNPRQDRSSERRTSGGLRRKRFTLRDL